MKQNRNVVRLTESQLKAMIAESVSNVLNEIGDTNHGQYMLGRLAARKFLRGGSTQDAGDVVMHGSNNNMNNHMGDDYLASGIADYASYSDPNNKLKPRAYTDDNGFTEYDFPNGSEEEERIHAKNRMAHIPKSVKDAVGNIEDFPEYAYGPYGFYDKDGYRVRNESRLRKIVSESIDRVLKNK